MLSYGYNSTVHTEAIAETWEHGSTATTKTDGLEAGWKQANSLARSSNPLVLVAKNLINNHRTGKLRFIICKQVVVIHDLWP